VFKTEFEMKELTKAEEQIMQILWEMEKGFVKDIVDRFPDPKPAYNTVSTIIRILEQKGFVDHTAYGKTHEYFPLVNKKEYTSSYMKNFIHNYFSGSFQEMVSFFAKEDKLTVKQLNELMKEVSRDIGTEKGSENE
jgi:BlaI family transcriptional regulator, penicillinase repressor